MSEGGPQPPDGGRPERGARGRDLRLVGRGRREEELRHEAAIRPRQLTDYVGQAELVRNLRVYVEASRREKRPLDHMLLAGPPGLGKTTLAHIVAEELGSRLRVTAGPAIQRAGELVALLSNVEPGDVLFIDEVHRLGTPVEEVLYSGMEDFVVDLVIGKGPAAQASRFDLPPFTLIGATTRSGLLSAPLRDRFGIVERLSFYPPEDLRKILERAAERLALRLDQEAAAEVARRSRGTPRIALRLLRRLRDFAVVESGGVINLELARSALERLGVDELGLDQLDRSLMRVILEHHQGGPVGLNTLAATLGEEPDTLEEVSEPYLLQIGFLERTPRGRAATMRARRHFDVPLEGSGTLFDS